MAKTKVDEWDTVPANNAEIDGISILGTAPASNMDNALRELMAQIRATPLKESVVDMVAALGLPLTYADVATLLADTALTYSDVTSGQIIRTSTEGFSYEVAASDAVDHHLTTAGGLKLYVVGAAAKIGEAYGAVADYDLALGTGTDDSSALQKLFTRSDADLSQVIDLSSTFKNFLLSSAALDIYEPGVLIRGNKGVTYSRGDNKNGNLIVDDTPVAAIRVGPDITPTTPGVANIADMWEFEHLGFRQATGVDVKTKSGVYFDRQTNGPDRGLIIRGCSASGMRALFEMAPKDAGAIISLANVVIENCAASNNRYAAYSGAPVYGLRFVGNQAEQNNASSVSGASEYEGGAIHGDWQGGITITDNMMEGQPNPIDINATAASIRAEVKRNYFETNNVNSSQFVSRFATSYTFLDNFLDYGPNFFSGTNFPSNFLIIGGKGNWQLTMRDRYAVTFENFAGSIYRNSNIFAPGIQSYKIKGIDVAIKMPEIYLGDEFSRADLSGQAIATVTLGVGGTGYTNGATVTLNATDNTGYGATATIAVTAGAITGFTVVSGGYGYTAGEALTITGGSGSGATATVGTITTSDWAHTKFTSGMLLESPYGQVYARDATVGIALNLPLNGSSRQADAGDLVVVNALVMIQDKTATVFRHQLTTGSGTFVASLGDSYADRISAGQWAMISYPIIVPSNQATLGFKFGISGGTVKAFVAGVSARNYGAYTNDGTVVQEVFPVIPRLV